MDSRSPFAGILLGQPSLARSLRLGVFAALDQRIAVRYNIGPMGLGDSTAYLRHHPRHGRQHSRPELPDAGPRPVRQGGCCYARLTAIASALFLAISLHLSCSLTLGCQRGPDTAPTRRLELDEAGLVVRP